MQTSINSPSNVTLQKFLLDSTTKQTIRTALASKPHLSALYATWCRHQEAVHHMTIQGSNIFMLLVDQGIGQAVALIRGEGTPVWKNSRQSITLHPPKGKKPLITTKTCTPSSEIETMTPQPKTTSVERVTIDLTHNSTPPIATPSTSRTPTCHVTLPVCKQTNWRFKKGSRQSNQNFQKKRTLFLNTYTSCLLPALTMPKLPPIPPFSLPPSAC